jgi:hypothetical protein
MAGERLSPHGGISHRSNHASDGERHFRRHHHQARLRHFSPSFNGYRIGSVTAVTHIESPAFNGTYVNSNIHDADGGTYIGSEGVRVYETLRISETGPTVKVLDIGLDNDPCEYEANVCVIRP